ILSNGVHTDIVLPIICEGTDWSRLIKFEHTLAKDTAMKYIAFGWGDKGFYLETPEWADLKARVAFKAMFYLGQSAMHTTFYKEMHEDERCVKIAISREAFEQLKTYIINRFQLSENGNVMHIKNHSYGDYDAFYEAKGSYGLFYTCNTWVNNGLKSCGQKACLWTPFDKGIFYQYKK
ncbi:MAG TPA: TIGR02117 family protein, partial [Bacteroidia bacterium]|nr:TIGR02117 family protein [Bacteroidia bacterium]